MKKTLFLTLFLALIVFRGYSQKNPAVTIGYLYSGNTGNHGVGVGFIRNVWKKGVFMTDANYFFKHYHGYFAENHQKEYYSRYIAFNLNLGYNVTLTKNINLIPYVGVGYFQEFINGYMSSEGTPPVSGVPHSGAPYHVKLKDYPSTITTNLGFLVEYHLSNRFMATGGLKYMLDTYDGTHNDFPYLTTGIGYKF